MPATMGEVIEGLSEAIRLRAEPNLKAALAQVAMEVNSRLQSNAPASSEFMKAAIQALSRMEGLDHYDLRINCLMDASSYYYLAGESFAAISPASSAVDLASAANDKPLLRKGLTFLGVMQADTGNVSRAIECYAQALDIAQELRDTESECIVWQNLGLALLYAAQYRDAITTFEHAVRLAGTNPICQKYRATALSNIALCCLHLEDFQRGLRAMETCLQETKEPHTTSELVARVLREDNYT